MNQQLNGLLCISWKYAGEYTGHLFLGYIWCVRKSELRESRGLLVGGDWNHGFLMTFHFIYGNHNPN